MNEYNRPDGAAYDIIPDNEEKRRIRKGYSNIGFALIAHQVIMYGIFIIIGLMGLMPEEAVYTEEGLYLVGFREALFSYGAPALSCVIVFFLFNALSGFKSRLLFQTKNITGQAVLTCIALCLFAQQASLLIGMGVNGVLSAFGFRVSFFDFEMSDDVYTFAFDLLTTVIIAPVAEELLFRGVILRSSSKISQKFGIVFSSVVFGLMHSNPNQAALGFCVGFFLAYFTIKTGSIITAMIAHSAVNLNASIPGILERAGVGDAGIYIFYYIWMFVLLIGGTYIFARAVGKGIVKFPQYSDFHKKRTLPIMIKSIPIILIFIFYLYDMGQSIERIPAETAETALEAARKFLLMG